MRQAGRYLPEYRALRKTVPSFWEAVFTPEIAAEITLQPLDRFKELDAAILFSDILVVPLGLGQDVWFEEGKGPCLGAFPDLSNPFNKDKFDVVLRPIYETLRIVKNSLPQEKALLGFTGAPWTLLSYMVGGGGKKERPAIKEAAFRCEALIDQALPNLIRAIKHYALRQVEAGAEVIQIFESWAGDLPEPYLRKWSIEPIQDITNFLRSSGIPVIVFPKGAMSYLDSYAFNIAGKKGPSALSLDSTFSEKALQSLPPRLCLQGGLDPQFVAVGGDIMIKEARRILTLMKERPYIFNLGHGMQPHFPIEHVSDLLAFVKSWEYE